MVTLRPVSESDEPVLFQLYASTRERELSQVPWTEAQKQAFLEMQFAAQTRSYASSYPGAGHLMICIGDRPVGRLYLARLADRFHILDITIDPRSRNAGHGSEVLKQVLEEADRAEKPVSIYVETFNPSLRLFERLGFGTAKVDGFQVLLERPTGISRRTH
jgi:ribosomal protein S18 acetylase RimI-like enzyme